MPEAAPSATELRSLAFNLAPARDMDPSWVEADPHAALLGSLMERPAASSWLSRYWLDQGQLSNTYWESFDTERLKIGLLEREELQHILVQVGTSLCRDEIQQIVGGAERAALRHAVGEDVLTFATQSAPLFGVPGDRPIPDDFDSLWDTFIGVGARELLDPAAMNAPGYGIRVGWKLPRGVADALRPEWAERADDAPRRLPGYERRMLREIAPQWSALSN